ncbi:phosphoribosylaminoimidazolesuccinocarboxamide synthase [Geothrix sp. PMB-07]|uniref:phosphoribosylaminoimidazolesuccinocarboxamide synthase n=1 Tax=Geothrix sp. PMB-07 TaxID=3068640 RepID=UPI002741FE94|nr:phosphoribosylaminoimidazolesuccinocarboxamide synthase [Geothrix sp. PMB-07]WLT31160.1 phosphoribosylaminoimidazolesuccinocarboxamide synthase [Geothrix sp. PMB-07]
MSILLSTDLPFPVFRRGKVRDVYDLGKQLLIVASDRISAFDCVMPEGIPDKGRILTAVANFWFAATEDLVPNHFRGNAGWPAALEPYRSALEGRAVVVEKTRPMPVECVVRGYIAGSGWKEYQATGRICGVSLPAGLRLADRLPEPIFTPATKEEEGHDENISFERMAEIVGHDLALRLRDLSLALYRRGAELAAERGILLADTKFEFGLSDEGELILIDEALTPDSSRYWLADSYQPGKNPPSLDKQFLRDYLETLSSWNKQPPAPHLPAEIIEGVRARYLDLASRFGVKL